MIVKHWESITINKGLVKLRNITEYHEDEKEALSVGIRKDLLDYHFMKRELQNNMWRVILFVCQKQGEKGGGDIELVTGMRM